MVPARGERTHPTEVEVEVVVRVQGQHLRRMRTAA
jgi:hypothetical protein